ncbi:MAG: hypothetical protein H6670_13780 [Anaerolineaceae bacterium]|nr:hypothetical protein [Anaerolineaceae bacterium]
MTTNHRSPEYYYEQIKKNESISSVQPIDLKLFSDIHKMLVNDDDLKGKQIATVIVYGDNGRKAVAVYPQISSRARLNICSDKRLNLKDFHLFLTNPRILGDIKPTGVKSRLRDEWKTLIVALVIVFISLAIFWFVSAESAKLYNEFRLNSQQFPLVQDTIDFYQTIGQSLLTIITLFLSVFILFTTAQNSSIVNDLNLYKTGNFHQYIRDDKYIIFISVCVLLLVFFGLGFSSVPQSFEVLSTNILINKINLWIPLLYSLAFGGLTIILVSLNYFFKRIIVARESNLVQQIISQQISSEIEKSHH